MLLFIIVISFWLSDDETCLRKFNFRHDIDNENDDLLIDTKEDILIDTNEDLLINMKEVNQTNVNEKKNNTRHKYYQENKNRKFYNYKNNIKKKNSTKYDFISL
jgi:hypothetical protein